VPLIYGTAIKKHPNLQKQKGLSISNRR